jgi:porin
MIFRQLGVIYAIGICKINRGSARAKLRLILLLSGFVMRSLVSSAQIGSGPPQAAARVQVEAKSSETTHLDHPPLFVGQTLDQDARVLSGVPLDPLLRQDPFQVFAGGADKAMNELRETEGVNFAATYTVVDQYATATPSGIRHNWPTGRFDLAGSWKVYDHGGNAGSLDILLRSGVNLGGSQDFNLSDKLGSALVLNCLPGGGPQEPITLNILSYRQDLYQRKLAFYLGKINPNEFISLSLYNNDERSQFLNAENDGNLTIPSDGTYAGGAALEFQTTQHIYVHLITVDTEGAQQRNLRSLIDKKYMNAVEFGWKSGAPTQQEHLFRLVVWRDDTATQGSGAVWDLDQIMS